MKHKISAFLIAIATILLATHSFAAPTVTDLSARQRYPWNGLVDISFTMSESGYISVVATNAATGALVPVRTLRDKAGNAVGEYTKFTPGEVSLVWDAGADVPDTFIETLTLSVVGAQHGRAQLWEGGPYWATENIGAEEPENYGLYFWWGDIVGYRREGSAWVASDGSSSNFSFSSDNTPTYGKSTTTLQSEGWITAEGVLAPEHDAAQYHWGGKWRMPTKSELNDLTRCTWTRKTQNGVSGYIVRGYGDYSSASIFLPAAGNGNGTSIYDAGLRGYYWSSPPEEDYSNLISNLAGYLYFDSGYYKSTNYDARYNGQSVRPVQGFAATVGALSASGATTTLRLDTRTAPIVAESIEITYEASWIGGDTGATVVISDNGYEVRRETGAGSFEHQIPESSGLHELICVTFVDGVAQKEVYRAAVYPPNTFVTVILDQQSGAGGTENATATIGSAMPSITVPTRTGYTFGGYYTSTGGSGTQYYTASGASARNWDKTAATTLYAKWTAKTYTITLDRQSGSGGTESVTATYGSAMPSITRPTRTGYTFGGYYTSTDSTGTQYYTASGTSVRSWDMATSTTLYAKWTVITATVTLDRQDGSGGSASVTATYGSAMPSITVPTRTGYTFGGYYTSTGGSGTQYYTDSGTSARNWDATARTLYAKWTANEYTVSFDATEGTVNQTSKSVTFDAAYGALPTPTRLGYSANWTLDGGIVTAGTVCKTASDHTLTAVWSPNDYTVSFDAAGGAVSPASKSATFDAAYGSLPTPARTGYTFGGWTLSGATVTAETICTQPSNHVLTAAWTPNEYTVSFDAMGGEVDPAPKSVTFDATYGTLPTPMREPYIFVDWRLDGAAVDAETVVTTPSNHVLSARWGVEIGNGICEETICDEPISLGTQIVAPSGEVVIPSEIDGRQVVKIGADTFAGNSRITSITIPASVTNIAEGAFAGCTGLKTVAVDSLRGDRFAEFLPELAESVERVVFLDGVANIPDNFFEGCTALKSMDIPESVVDIGTNVFEACSALATTEADGLVFYQGWVLGFAEGGAPGGRALPDLVIPASHGEADGSGSRPYPVRGIAAGAFRGEWGIATVELPESLVFIGAGAFENCTGLEDVAVPTNVWKIDRDAFRNCTYAQGLSLPEGALKVIGDGAFANGSSLLGIALPDGVSEVGDGAFSNCWRAASVSLPQSVERVGDGAFADCRRVAGATVPLHVRPMAELFPAAYSNIQAVAVAELGGAPGELALPGDGNDAPEDGSGAPGGRALPEDLVSSHQMVPGMFAGCAALEGVALPEWVRNVPDGAFEGCAAMESIALPGAVTNVGTRAFADCASLQGVALPSGLESVSNGAFAGCAALAEIAFPGRMGRLGSGIFSGCANLRFARFAGNAPDFESANGGPYAGAPPGFFSYVEKGSTGWDGVATSRTLPEHWPMDTAFEIRFWDPDAAFAALDAGTMPFVTCGGGDWAEDSAESVVGGSSLRSGHLPKAEDSGRTNTTLRTTVSGTGTVSFWWKVGCEPEDADYDEWYDYAAFSVDGEEAGRIAGDSGWARVSCDISGPGPHVLEWTFTRDDYDEPGADWPNCLWVDAVEWTMTGATLAEAVDAPALAFTTGGAEDWDVDAMNGWTNGVSAKSGAVANGEASWVETMVEGEGTLAFHWKVMGGLFRNTPFAYAKVEIDGASAVQTHLTDGWEGQTLGISGEGTHVVRWTYLRTSARVCDGDCAWLDGVSWTPLATPAYTETQTTPESVPYSWLEADAATILSTCGGDYEEAGNAMAANGVNKVWECYVAGISPTNAAARFEATIEMGADGKPVVRWNPPLAPEEEAKRMRKVLGKRTLVPTEDWVDVTDEADPDAAGYRFFKVKVEMK